MGKKKYDVITYCCYSDIDPREYKNKWHLQRKIDASRKEKSVRLQQYLEDVVEGHGGGFSYTNGSFKITEPDVNAFSIDALYGMSKQHLDEFLMALDKFFLDAEKVVFGTIKDVVGENGEVIEAYRTLWNRNVNAIFLDSEWLNIEFMKKNKIGITTAVNFVKITIETMNHENVAYTLAKKKIRQEKIASGEQKYNYNKGETLHTNKEKKSLDYIKKNSKTFGGKLTNEQLQKNLKIGSVNTILKYKRIIKEQMEEDDN